MYENRVSEQNPEVNEQSLDTVCGALAYAFGIESPKNAADPSSVLCTYIDEKLKGKKADRIFMYNPDAIAQWIYEKYPQLFTEVDAHAELKLPLQSVMPSVTPVCYATMYTGAQPSVHGIRSYVKPVIQIDTLFDALIRAGKKPVIIAHNDSSLAKIYLERDMDYFMYDSVAEINAKAAEIIIEDKYDFIVVYNDNYDTQMHKNGPESLITLSEARINSQAFGMFSELIASHWNHHNTLVGFAMDHGCHAIDGGSGSHGLDMAEDLNITHLYKIYSKNNKIV